MKLPFHSLVCRIQSISGACGVNSGAVDKLTFTITIAGISIIQAAETVGFLRHEHLAAHAWIKDQVLMEKQS